MTKIVMIEVLLNEDTNLTEEEIQEEWEDFSKEDLTTLLEDKVLNGRIVVDGSQFVFGDAAICARCGQLKHVNDIYFVADKMVCKTCDEALLPEEDSVKAYEALMSAMENPMAKDLAEMGKLFSRASFAGEMVLFFQDMRLAAVSKLNPLLQKYQVKEEPVEALEQEGLDAAEAEHQADLDREEDERLKHEHEEEEAKQGRVIEWRKEDIDILSLYDSKEELMKRLPGRSWSAIRGKKYRLNHSIGV